MSSETRTRRAPVWLEGLDDWSWPGQSGAAAEILPPPWVPAFPPRAQPAAPGLSSPVSRARGRRRLLWLIAGSLACLCLILALGRTSIEQLIGLRTAEEAAGAVRYSPAPPAALPGLRVISTDAAGSSIGVVHFQSRALHGPGTFLVYLPPGVKQSSAAHYPVIYLLHGNDQLPVAFLEMGLQGQLDQLISSRAIGPMIAVMIQGGRGANNWRNWSAPHYESYVIETQELVDRMLPTSAVRGGRAIAGLSMGGYGAMAIALDHPTRFSVVESWLGFFNGLQGQLQADEPLIARQGLHAFIYGAASDKIADPSQDPIFGEELTEAGVQAQDYIYPGQHNVTTVGEHLSSMLTYAAQQLGSSQHTPAPLR